MSIVGISIDCAICPINLNEGSGPRVARVRRDEFVPAGPRDRAPRYSHRAIKKMQVNRVSGEIENRSPRAILYDQFMACRTALVDDVETIECRAVGVGSAIELQGVVAIGRIDCRLNRRDGVRITNRSGGSKGNLHKQAKQEDNPYPVEEGHAGLAQESLQS